MYGTITSSGLYTPPATFPANPAEIIATSLGTPVTKATQFVYFLSPGPPITLVSPNPIPVGTSTVTITGSGFQKGAVIDYTTPGAAPVQASAKFVSSTTLTASVYLALPTTATFYVINPGTAPSNSLSVTVGASNTVALNVINGSGSGNYAPGTVVTITANPAPTGEFFSSWTGATVASATSPSTTITVRSNSATVTANYSSSQTTTYPLTVVNGFGSGNYAAGTVVSIAAITAPSGQVFGSWTGAAVASASSAYTTITMPAAATTVTANYTAALATYLLTVYNGSGSGNYAAGTSVTIASGPPPSGQVFGSWSGATVASATSATTTLTMPAAATTVTANFAAAPSTNFTLTVNSGSGGGSYPAGTVVTITANTAPSGQFFSYWTGAEVASATSATTTLTMPAAATTVTANYSSTARITIAPAGYVAIPANGTVQFSATVTGVSNASVAVTWSVAGNSATYGTITPAGLYTAPATIPANPAQITATGSGASASHYVYFLVPGPTLTQIAPNPIPSGTTTITLTGSGFQNGAEAVISNTGVQLSTAFVSANTLTASNYFASGTTATFYVVNPGSAPSNSITVPVSGPAAYALTVINGSGSGNYTAGTAVTISAGSPPAGQELDRRVGRQLHRFHHHHHQARGRHYGYRQLRDSAHHFRAQGSQRRRQRQLPRGKHREHQRQHASRPDFPELDRRHCRQPQRLVYHPHHAVGERHRNRQFRRADVHPDRRERHRQRHVRSGSERPHRSQPGPRRRVLPIVDRTRSGQRQPAIHHRDDAGVERHRHRGLLHAHGSSLPR
jgi:hypothetical protein